MKQVCTYPREEADVDYQKLGTLLMRMGLRGTGAAGCHPQEVTTTYLDTFRMAGLQVDM